MQKAKKNIAVIGAGFSGLSAAAVLAAEGHQVTIFEKNAEVGGRARAMRDGGYLFDMGPSWYWMPGVFESYFALFNKKPEDYYKLRQLDPGFVIWFGAGDQLQVPASMEGIYELFDREEQDGAVKLKAFLAEAETKYNLALSDFIFKPAHSALEFVNLKFLSFLFRLTIFSSFHTHVRKYFRSRRLIQLMEFPILFLGGSPQNIPGLYSLMNYAALKLGTWYPEGGFSTVTNGMAELARELGTRIHVSEAVTAISVENERASTVTTEKTMYEFDAVICAADYAHGEQLLDKRYRNYSEEYWNQRVFSPSSLIFYLGINKRLPSLHHHNLFFDTELSQHTDDIYKNPRWPENPLFYVCCPSRTDASVAPAGHENLFILMPVAAGLEDSAEIRERYFQLIIKRLEAVSGETDLSAHIDYKRSYCIDDFSMDYNSFKGNAYGLANTLTQSAFMKPVLRNKKIKNLFYAGQLTVPGPGVPPAIISGQIAAKALLKTF